MILQLAYLSLQNNLNGVLLYCFSLTALDMSIYLSHMAYRINELLYSSRSTLLFTIVQGLIMVGLRVHGPRTA